jgi:hypothetical protein
VPVSTEVLAVLVGQVEQRRALWIASYQSARFCAAAQCELTSSSSASRSRVDRRFDHSLFVASAVRTCGG